MPASTTFEEQDEAAKNMEQQILALEGVDVVQSTVGSAADGRVAFGAAASGIAFTIIADEDADIEAMQSKVLQLNAPEDSEITTSQGGGFGSSETIDIQVLASDNDLLQETVDKVAAAMDDITDVSAVTTTGQLQKRTDNTKRDQQRPLAGFRGFHLIRKDQKTGCPHRKSCHIMQQRNGYRFILFAQPAKR